MSLSNQGYFLWKIVLNKWIRETETELQISPRQQVIQKWSGGKERGLQPDTKNHPYAQQWLMLTAEKGAEHRVGLTSLFHTALLSESRL